MEQAGARTRRGTVATGAAALLVLVLCVPASAQTTVSGRATLTVGDLMTLEVVPVADAGIGAAAGTGDDFGPLRVEVRANRGWRLVVVATGAATRWSAVVADGTAGRSVVEVDGGWLADAGLELEPGVQLAFSLSPN